jgi:hypothetical protein
MPEFYDPLWGYALVYPEGWVHRRLQDTDAFAAAAEALQPDYEGPRSGHLLVRPEWNGALQPVGPLWERHIGQLASMLGSRKVGAAPWRMAGAAGLEAEVALPKQSQRRLWVGILVRGFTVLKFMVSHHKSEWNEFQPALTTLVASLRFRSAAQDEMDLGPEGLPLPHGCFPVDPGEVISDIADTAVWRAYRCSASAGALQAFFVRELPLHGWTVESFEPHPAVEGLGFARLRLRLEETRLTLGVLPETGEAGSRAAVVLRFT